MFFNAMNLKLMHFELLAAENQKTGVGMLLALIAFIVASVWLGTLAQRVVKRSSFVKGFFLGNRGLGAWAIALTATVQSGGTFMGFPSLVYSHGWIVALWIGSYMVVPITGFGLIGKRIAQLSRRTGAVTMPELFRERFDSPILGVLASVMIVTFMSFMMIAQFKAGAILMKYAWPGTEIVSFAEDAPIKGFDPMFLLGLALFAITVVGYTLIGGFLAAVWTDLFQSVMMFLGILLLVCLAIPAAGGLEQATRTAVVNTGPGFAFGPGYAPDGRAFLPLSLAISFFFFWPSTGFSSPAGIVRIMACKDTNTIRHSIFLLCAYNLGIYLPLICICVCARAIVPNLASTDEVIPNMAVYLTKDLPLGNLIAGLILAAPFGAVMATVSSYLVVIASGLVRDVYQRIINPQATETQLKRAAWGTMIAVGILAVVCNIQPIAFLQAIVVFSTGCAGASFIVPTVMLCYWRRATAHGVMAAMIAGAITVLTLYAIGFAGGDPMIGNATAFRPYFLFGIEPLLWGVLSSTIAGTIVSVFTRPPADERVSKWFDKQPDELPPTETIVA